MTCNTRKPVIDYTSYISDRITDFTGRAWVFQAVNNWLAKPDGSRYFLLTGEPGSGKTAIASRLSQFSQGSIPPPVGTKRLTPHFLSAVHFCSARDSRWINPYTFTESLALQLAEHYPAYAHALTEKSGDRQLRIEVQQHIGHGQGTGIVIHRLDVSGGAVEDVFNRVVREPLEALYQSEFDQQIVILVDALDEAMSYSGSTSIIPLLAHINDLPSGVLFILTSRPDSRVEHAFLDAETLALSATQFDERNQEDIRHYVQDWLKKNTHIIEQMTQLDSRWVVEQMIETIVRKAEGNFLYVRFLLNAIANGERLLTELEGLPQGLDRLYFESLQRVIELGKGDWHREYAPILGMLSVAQESPTLLQLQSFTRQSHSSLLKYLDELWQFIEEIQSPNKGETRYRPYHQSVIDFFHRQSLLIHGKEVLNAFYLPTDEYHKALADWCEKDDLTIIWKDRKYNPSEQGRREYARQHFITHLYLAKEWDHLLDVLNESAYGQAKIQYDTSMQSYSLDLELGRRVVADKSWPLDQAIANLPLLWQYTLLQCNLVSRAHNYPRKAFRLMLLLGQEAKAVGLAELLPESLDKVSALTQIAEYLVAHPDRRVEGDQMLIRAYEMAKKRSDFRDFALTTVGESFIRVGKEQNVDEVMSEIEFIPLRYILLGELWKVLAQEGQWHRIEEMILQLKDEYVLYPFALAELGKALAHMGQLHRIEEIIALLEKNSVHKALVSIELGKALAQMEQHQQAEVVWRRTVEELVTSGLHPKEIDSTLRDSVKALSQANHWQIAVEVIEQIKSPLERTIAQSVLLGELGRALAQRGQLQYAEATWSKAEEVIGRLADTSKKDSALSELVNVLIQAKQWQVAEEVAEKIGVFSERSLAFIELGIALAQAGQSQRANVVWEKVEESIKQREDLSKRSSAFIELGIALSQAGQLQQAEAVWNKVEVMVEQIEDLVSRGSAFNELGKALAQGEQLQQAEAVWNKVEVMVEQIEDHSKRDRVLSELGAALVQGGQGWQAEAMWKKAEKIIGLIKSSYEKELPLSELVKALVQTGQWQDAEALIERIEDYDVRVAVLRELVKALGQSEKWQVAEALIAQLKFPEDKALVLIELWIALAQEGQGQHVEALIERIEDLIDRGTAFDELGIILAQAGNYQQTQEIHEEVTENLFTCEQLIEVLSKLGIILAKSRQWQRTEKVIRLIGELEEVLWGNLSVPAGVDIRRGGFLSGSSSVLSELGKALAQERQWQRAQEMIKQILVLSWRVPALTELGKILAQSDQHQQAHEIWMEAERAARQLKETSLVSLLLETLITFGQHRYALEIVQNLWLQVRTRDEALEMLAIATPFIRFRPELGKAFCESFTWVDGIVN